MERRLNDPKKRSTDHSSINKKGRVVTCRVQSAQASRNTAVKKSARKRKKSNRLEELAKKLNIPRSTIYLYAQNQKIPCVRIGNRYVLPDDIEERIKSIAYENWTPQNDKLQRPRKKEGDSPASAARRRGIGQVWLSPRQFARRFGVGTSAVYGAVERGEVPAFRIGRHIRIPPDSVEAILHLND
jgi:excisionase family DNA binding protein